MKYLSNISRIHNFWNRFGAECVAWDIFLCHFFSCSQQLKITKLPTRENFGPTKYPREKILDPQSTQKKKFGTHQIPTVKNFRPTKYPRRHDYTMALEPRDPR